VSELLPHFASIVDDVTLIRSMHTDINGHEPSIWFMNTGKSQPDGPRSVRGSPTGWALTTKSAAYVVLTDPGGHPVDGVRKLVQRLDAAVVSGNDRRVGRAAHSEPRTAAALEGRVAAQNLAFLAGSIATISRVIRVRRTGSAHRQLRTRRADAERREGSADLFGESEATKKPVRPGRSGHARIRTRCLIARAWSSAASALCSSSSTVRSGTTTRASRRTWSTAAANRPPPRRS